MPKTRTSPRLRIFLTTGVAALSLAACQTVPSPPAVPPGSKVEMSRESLIQSVYERSHEGRDRDSRSLSALERAYKQNSADAETATAYARALRNANALNRAALVLAPFANNPASPAAAKSEYAAILLAQGNMVGAETYAQKAIMQDPADYEAFHYLGIALDAQKKHVEAERAFRKGLEHWQGDPTAIINNLALNLAAQGFLDEATDLLQQAKAAAPGRIEIERNLRIIMALKESNYGIVPKPVAKPAAPAPSKTAEPLKETEASEAL